MTEFLLLALVVAVVALIIKLRGAHEKIGRLESRLARLEDTVQRGPAPLHESRPVAAPAQVTSRAPEAPQARPRTADSGIPVPSVTPPKLPPLHPPEPALATPVRPPEPPRPAVSKPREPIPSSQAPAGINWEKFLGVRLFAWVGGLALFLGVAFFVKYSFEQGLISPAMRVAIGVTTGIGLIAGGLRMPRERHVVTVQTLCATGILILYASFFAAHALYGFIGTTTAFVLMAGVTVAAFTLAIRLQAQVVAVLGLVAAFLTPPLLSSVEDRPFGLFGYVALLDLGLLAVALRQRWNYMTLLAAAGTVLLQWGWVARHFQAPKTLLAMGIFLAFIALFALVLFLAHRLKTVDKWMLAASLLLPASAMGFAFLLLAPPYAEVANYAVPLFGFVFLVDLGLLAMAAVRSELRSVQLLAGGPVFAFLTSWTLAYLAVPSLNVALWGYLIFAVLHAVSPVLLQKWKPVALPTGWGQLFAPAALLLILVPIFELPTLSPLLWPVVLLIDITAIVLAIATASLISILVVFFLTAVASALWIVRVPPELSQLPGMMVLVGGFAVFFMAAAAFAAHCSQRRGEAIPQRFGESLAVAAALPFMLITLMIIRLPLESPVNALGLAALLVLLLLAVTRLTRFGLLTLTTLVAALLPQCVWYLVRFSHPEAASFLVCTTGFAAFFLLFPFLFRRQFQTDVWPWLTAALAFPVHYPLLHDTVKEVYPNPVMGLLPLALALPHLVGLAALRKSLSPDNPKRNAILALLGGASLFFITLAIPVQFDRQWITLGWALEGVALIWLFHRIPHQGLKIVGTILLVTAFVRLALNPEVLHYRTRLDSSIFNWYLYTYSIAAACLLGGGWLLAPPRNRIRGFNVPPLLYSLGAILAFLLLNIEIANHFSTHGRLVFKWSANLGQDMTYSLCWALFAFALLGVGFKTRNAPTRYAGMGLLVVTLLKLFLHDLWQLGGLYRIGSLVGLAVVLILVSFIYQRFLSAGREGAGS